MGGMFGESKYDILKKIPEAYRPNTVLIKMPATKTDVMKALLENSFSLPVIFKPDLGERGFMVKRIRSKADVELYLQIIEHDFLIQDLVDLPLEFGVFYVRHPSEKAGRVTSIVMKEMLAITGDGASTLATLILAKDRAKLQWPVLHKTFRDRLSEIVPAGKTIELVSIGNHCLGTTFLDASHLISDQMSASFDRISLQIEGFYFGRFDLRCQSVDDLTNGNVQIMELNGCGAEPAHIYQPGFPFFKAVGIMFTHWRNIFSIAQENHRRGVPFVSLADGVRYYKKFKKATRIA